MAWDYMEAVLRFMGLGNLLLSFVMALYTNPIARVWVNGLLSNAFPICNVTKQGCPLSLLLFTLTLEPLLRSLKSKPNIRGIHTYDKEYKLVALADDILLFLTEPQILLPNLLAEFRHFRLISNLKIHFSKSCTLNICLPKHTVTVTQYQRNFPFQWKEEAITYLGIQLP